MTIGEIYRRQRRLRCCRREGGEVITQRNVIDETTNDFVGAFPTASHCTGWMARLIASGCLPQCVDPNNARVKQIIEWAKASAKLADDAGKQK